MFTVKLPKLSWFIADNIYTGSLTVYPTTGSLCQTTFNYKARIIEEGSEKYLAVICFHTLPWNSVTNMSEAVLGRFEATDFGIEVAEKWILSKILISPADETIEKKTDRLLNVTYVSRFITEV